MAFRAKVLGLFLLLLFSASLSSAQFVGLGSNVTGSWTVKMGHRIVGTAELSQSGSQVTGWFEPNAAHRIPVSGVLLSERLIITTHPEARQLVAFERCELDAGSSRMNGAFYPGNGKIQFVKMRQPHLPSRLRNWHP